MNKEYRHVPVMLEEVIQYLNPQPGQRFIDCTLGGAGYTSEIAKRIGQTGRVLSFDLDKMAIENAKERIKKEKLNNIILANENFRNLSKIVKEHFLGADQETGREEDDKFDGVVFDLGLSSAQLEDKSRGFSFQLDAPLDMAFGQEGVETERILSNYKQVDLERIIRDYGEERFARRIAERIVAERKVKQIRTTKELVEIVSKAVPAVYRNNPKIHFATRTFQALRIATNKELENIEEALPQALDVLKEGGKIAVISYHSLEDRIVKNFFRQESRDCVCPTNIPICECGHKARLKIITKKPLLPGGEEIKNNPRSRSAKMRVAQKI